MPRGGPPTTRRSPRATYSASKQAQFDGARMPLACFGPAARVSANMRIVCDAVRNVTGQPTAGRSKLYTFAHGEGSAHPEAAFLVCSKVAFEPFKHVKYISIASL
jgi:hypothetical protein